MSEEVEFYAPLDTLYRSSWGRVFPGNHFSLVLTMKTPKIHVPNKLNTKI